MEYKQMKVDRPGGADVPHQERTTHRTSMTLQQDPVTGAIRLSLCGRPTFLCGGELHNSAASTREDIASGCDRLVRLGCNAVLAPVSWELIEPREGDFDLTLVDALVGAARDRGIFLVPLWFGAFKNAIGCYAPEWVKLDDQRFPRVRRAPGMAAPVPPGWQPAPPPPADEPGLATWTFSCHAPALVEADARAFAALMRRLSELDPDGSVVAMVQVENEVGIMQPRDRSAAADVLFAAPVPEVLLAGLERLGERLDPDLATRLDASGRLPRGDWTTAFGRFADEVFMAWHIAGYCQRVASAGKAVWAVPMFTNAWLPAGPGYEPGQCPSGGPVPRVLDVWRLAAPDLDALAPDIYQEDYRAWCARYDRPGNPLIIPESRPTPAAATQALYAIGRHRAICVSTFGTEDCAPGHPLAEVHRLLRDFAPWIASGATWAWLQQADQELWDDAFAGWRFRVRSSRPRRDGVPNGAALLISLGRDEFLLLGLGMTLVPVPADGCGEAMVLRQDEVAAQDGRLVALRRRNGDESAHGSGILLGDHPVAISFHLHRYR